jgi:hypothetical protein
MIGEESALINTNDYSHFVKIAIFSQSKNPVDKCRQDFCFVLFSLPSSFFSFSVVWLVMI